MLVIIAFAGPRRGIRANKVWDFLPDLKQESTWYFNTPKNPLQAALSPIGLGTRVLNASVAELWKL